MRPTVVIRRCATLPEALVCRGLLEANDVHASLDEYYHAANAWWHVAALNGVSLSVAAHDSDRARELLKEHAKSGPGLLEQEFGPYEKPRRYGVFAAWFMLLEYILHIPGLILTFMLAGLLSLLDRILPAGWFTSSYTQGSGPWMPEIRAGSYNPVFETSFEPEGVLFVIVIFLVFLADRLIKPESETKEDPS